jgi:hypothetical protein
MKKKPQIVVVKPEKPDRDLAFLEGLFLTVIPILALK